jgi:hypothetical protein
MRKTIPLIIGALLLGACTETVVREVPATDPPRTSVEQKPVDDPMREYLDYVNANATNALYVEDSVIAEAGNLICQALDEGSSFTDITLMLDELSTSEDDSMLYAAMLYGAVQYLCPEYKSALDRYIASI